MKSVNKQQSIIPDLAMSEPKYATTDRNYIKLLLLLA